MLNMMDARVLTFCTNCYNNVSRNKYPPAQQHQQSWRITLKIFATRRRQNISWQQIFNLRYHHLGAGEGIPGINKYSFVVRKAFIKKKKNIFDPLKSPQKYKKISQKKGK